MCFWILLRAQASLKKIKFTVRDYNSFTNLSPSNSKLMRLDWFVWITKHLSVTGRWQPPHCDTTEIQSCGRQNYTKRKFRISIINNVIIAIIIITFSREINFSLCFWWSRVALFFSNNKKNKISTKLIVQISSFPSLLLLYAN